MNRMFDFASLDLVGLSIGISFAFAFLLFFLYVLRSPEQREAEKLAKNP